MHRLKILLLLIGALFFWSCQENIVSVCEEDSPSANGPTTFTFIQEEVFNKSCALAGCHGDFFMQGGLALTEGNAYDNIVGVKASGSELNRIEPGNSAESYLIQKINTDMPPTGLLAKSLRDSIAAWVDRGAPNN